MPKKKLPPELRDIFKNSEVLEFFKKQGAKGGKIGGAKAWEKLTPEQRTERAKKAVAAREAKRKAAAGKAKGKTK